MSLGILAESGNSFWVTCHGLRMCVKWSKVFTNRKWINVGYMCGCVISGVSLVCWERTFLKGSMTCWFLNEYI